MNKKEKRLVIELCKFKKTWFDKELLEYATPAVLGYIFYNRMQAIAFDRLRKHNLLGKINREFRSALQMAYEQNAMRNKSFFQCIDMVTKILSACSCKVAMLKGAYLCLHYPEGYRTSNDIDLLVMPEDITVVGDMLADAGFKQGSIQNGKFIPASRIDIIESRVLRGEVVPYIKEVNLPYMKYLEVDINFSLDYKNGNDHLVQSLLNNIYIAREKHLNIPTLNKTDFFIHLCAHLYKEATTIPWIEMRRDMTLYKYCDIYYLLSEMDEKDVENVFSRSKDLGLEKICAYAILETMCIFDMNNEFTQKLAIEALDGDFNFLLQVISPKNKKKFIYRTRSAKKRFFTENRIRDLMEVTQNETS